ncbi:Lipoprotein VacJ [Rubellimicrobium mesophilum DSM 19309]|uniref:Lipoprotein VacJ n=1 Tax=Rubellimicrobium mesophilum DSM 19309 TaxID=442562 RepID=A0A017HW15_9RHOB|nr:VacJ family lipoprotein [Rubellimicrobium mesophilum]EYD78368.1 Lipoprotein VacJ [Rubellimicrobium mesophilum DSM 19309]
MKRCALVFVLLSSAAGCTVAPPETGINDPYEPFNRQVHAFNKSLDQAVLRPLARAGGHAPEGLGEPVVNFAGNAGLPGTVVNNLLQGDIGGAATNTLRFLVNTTVGLAGLADPASAIGLHEVETDFGATLARWGVPEGAYLELPVLGPSTERDATGRVVDLLLDPLDRLDRVPREMRDYALPAQLAEEAIDRARLGATFDDVLYGSADSYAQARLIYLQNRRFELGEDQASEDRYINPYEDQ